MKGYDETAPNYKTPSSTVFFSQCVRINKPCVLQNLARSWPMFEKGSVDKSLATIGKDTKVQVYKQPKSINKYASNVYSFPEAYRREMTYGEFLDMYSKEDFPSQVVMRTSEGMAEKLMPVIKMPTFYSNIAELEGIEIMQGQGYKDKPLYKKKE